MTPTEVTTILKHLDGWPVQHHSTKKVQEAIDAAIEMIEEAEEDRALREKLADILTRTANALKGEPKPLHRHSWHDLPDVAWKLVAVASDLLEALKEIMPYTATVNIGCHGEKCREPWCHSCNSEEEAEAAAQRGCNAWAKARAAIAKATGEQP